MSHPVNRRERFLIGKKLGEKRAKGMFQGDYLANRDPEVFKRIFDHSSRIMRNTGKMCSCYMCQNRRINPWVKDKLTMQEVKFEEACRLEQID